MKPSSNKIIQGQFPGGQPHRSVILRDNVPSNNNKVFFIQPKLNQFRQILIQKNGQGNAFKVDPNRLNLNGHGNPIPQEILNQMESVFNTDFSSVKIHTGGYQAESIGALAFTTGNDIYFAQGYYNPNTTHGQRLLGHELTHVVQQRSGRVRNPFENGITVVNDPGLEAEAERMSIKSQTLQMLRGPKKLIRTNFSKETQKKLVLKRGQHRRHIISHHHIKDALQSWYDYHGTSLSKLQFFLDRMNNNTNNLIPGSGNVNTAIGMLSHQLEEVIKTASKKKKLKTKDLYELIGKYKGFQIKVQKELTLPVYEIFKNDQTIKGYIKEALAVIGDVQFSTDFDWPGDPDTSVFHQWEDVYMRFLDLKKFPQCYSLGDIKKLYNKFMKLPKPSGKHD